MKSNEEIMSDQAVEMRELIPDYVDGKCTESMACCPTEVFYFANLYIKELQEENMKLKDELDSKNKVNVFGKMIENLKDENFIKSVSESMSPEPETTPEFMESYDQYQQRNDVNLNDKENYK
ncbi:hypothetical protein [Lysinibacillus sp. Bpr_S20]|uniref:hypothetical protein n=1 Tax=Lysinibacillus sp. Bpr_S20 TaxID=2933964 RepID=UPI002011F14C|nr:hypothetical protein [Lysinibacillus sp. Bpr_S20]MCL1700758.1 hypothetical protein [Lysinibacillus sp. Bpr_S20]